VTLACVDVHYRDDGTARAAALLFDDWCTDEPRAELTATIPCPAEYVPGSFYRRELPCVLAVLQQVVEPLAVVVVDGYVWIGKDEPGLGAHLYRALQERTAVVGVAKSPYQGSVDVVPVLRGESTKPLYVGAIGMPVDEAADRVRTMAGEHRMPLLLKRLDRLSRD